MTSTRRLPTVTLVVAMRNEAAYIERCLASLAAQDYPPDALEVLVYERAHDTLAAASIGRSEAAATDGAAGSQPAVLSSGGENWVRLSSMVVRFLSQWLGTLETRVNPIPETSLIVQSPLRDHRPARDDRGRPAGSWAGFNPS